MKPHEITLIEEDELQNHDNLYYSVTHTKTFVQQNDTQVFSTLSYIQYSMELSSATQVKHWLTNSTCL